MSILSGILCFLEIADLVFKVKEKFTSKPDKEKYAVFLHLVGELLLDVSNHLEEGRYPHDKCQEMWHYLQELRSAMKSVLTDEQAGHLVAQITEAHRVEQLFGQMGVLNQQEKAEQLQAIRSAAGSFIAVSNLLRVK